MTTTQDSRADRYEDFYRQFDSPLMRQVRREAHGEDIGQHSWVGADELRADIARLGLERTSRFLDLGCGPCGPLTFILANAGCFGTGLEISPAALEAGRGRAMALRVDHLLSVREADFNEPLPFESGSFDAAMALDVVLHVRDRSRLFREVARVLSPGRRFLVTDAGVVTGTVSNEEIRRRSVHGFTQFVPPGSNEALLEASGFRVIETEDRTESALKNAGGRLAAMEAHRAELEVAMGTEAFRGQCEYLGIVVELARRKAMSRMVYSAEVHAPRAG